MSQPWASATVKYPVSVRNSECVCDLCRCTACAVTPSDSSRSRWEAVSTAAPDETPFLWKEWSETQTTRSATGGSKSGKQLLTSTHAVYCSQSSGRIYSSFYVLWWLFTQFRIMKSSITRICHVQTCFTNNIAFKIQLFVWKQHLLILIPLIFNIISCFFPIEIYDQYCMS